MFLIFADKLPSFKPIGIPKVKGDSNLLTDLINNLKTLVSSLFPILQKLVNDLLQDLLALVQGVVPSLLPKI